MRINSSDRKISLIIKAINERIVPELKSDGAQATASIINDILSDLIKRENGTPVLLRRIIDEGLDLAGEVVSVLDAGVDFSFITSLSSDSLTDLIEQHDKLTEALAELAESLAESEVPMHRRQSLLRKIAQWELSFYTQQAKLEYELPVCNDERGVPLTKDLCESFLRQSLSRTDLSVSEFNPIPGGFGKQTYICSYSTSDVSNQELVIRKTDPTPIMKHGACNLRNEFDLLTTLAEVDYLSPKPIQFCSDFEKVDGSFYTMDRLPGAPPGSYLGGMKGDVEEELFFELAALLGRLHNLPLEMFSDYIHKYEDPLILSCTTEECYRYNLSRWFNYMKTEAHLQSPFLFWLLDWLNNNIPADTRAPILIHGDFNIHNVLVDKGHVTAVLDWECAGFGCPEQDLAYIKPHIEGHVDWDKFVRHYQDHGGKKINPDAMSFGSVYASLRTNLAGNRATYNLQAGLNQDIRYAMVEQGFTASFMGMALEAAKPA